MGAAAKAYLVLRHPDGVGNVHPLLPGKRYTLGRARTNEIVLNDDLCSRQHAEVFPTDAGWRVRDCGSLNGVRVNGARVAGECELVVGDEVGLGNSRLVFVENLGQLPPPPNTPRVGGVAIKKKLGQTRFDLAVNAAAEPLSDKTPVPDDPRHRLGRDLSLLYRLALDMGSAATTEELVAVVLRGLLEATDADTAAVLAVKDGRQLKLVGSESKQKGAEYLKLPANIGAEVLASKVGVLAEDADRLRQRDGAAGVVSLICAPVLTGDKVEALIHLYGTDPLKALGADDLELTVAVGKQLAVATQALNRQEELREENQRLKAQVATEVQLVGTSPAILEVEAQITRAAATNATVLIRGESGSGKELVARAIHLASPRRQGPFVCLNCAALPESLLESELFGHEKGSFTGATERKIGKFEAAHQGTIFLDEIGEMTLGAQAKLLRILEGHPYERVGGNEPIRVNTRVVAATNRPLEEAVAEGQFRQDLYFRLQVVELRLPPLRERTSDIPLLAEFFLQKFLRETGRKIRGFTPAAMAKMQAYHWPGNIRELRNVVERAVALANGPMLDAGDIWLSSLKADQARLAPAENGVYEPVALEEVEKRHISATLKHTEWNKSRAADILGIERSTLDRKIKAYELKRG